MKNKKLTVYIVVGLLIAHFNLMIGGAVLIVGVYKFITT